MRKNLQKINKLLEIIQYKNFFNLVSISVIISIMEFLSIFSIYPVFYYLENKSIINNQYYIYVIELIPFVQNQYIFEKIIFISLSIILITALVIYLRFSRKYKIKEEIINRNRSHVFKLISETNLYFFKKINQELVKSYLSIETQRISQIVLSFTNICSSFFIILFLCVFIISIDLNLIFILVFTVFILYFLLSKTYAESKTLGSNLVGLNDRFMKFIDKILNDKTQFMLSNETEQSVMIDNEVVKKIHSNQFQIQKKSAFVEFVIKISTLSIILLVIYVFYLKKVELSLILFSGLIFVRLVPYMSQFGNSLQNLKSNFPSLDKLIFLEKNLKRVEKINLNTVTLKYIEISSSILDAKNIDQIDKTCFRIKPGDIYGLFGSSGIGKTTFLESFLGLDQNDSFKISLNGETDISNAFNPKILSNASYFTQNSIPNTFLISEIFSNFNISKVENYFNKFHLKFQFSSVKSKKLEEFSGGELQRLCLIYFLLHNKKVIILDEPTSSLDTDLSLLVLKIIKEHVKKYNNLCVIVSHDENLMYNINSFFTLKSKVKIK
ncbi:ATP-binding cassette domain-containing protein [Alphaproteobacteria bacterium]|nr:ATP-binding cassette domain-containing protein [Alphaproteobacteria bacterium]